MEKCIYEGRFDEKARKGCRKEHVRKLITLLITFLRKHCLCIQIWIELIMIIKARCGERGGWKIPGEWWRMKQRIGKPVTHVLSRESYEFWLVGKAERFIKIRKFKAEFDLSDHCVVKKSFYRVCHKFWGATTLTSIYTQENVSHICFLYQIEALVTPYSTVYNSVILDERMVKCQYKLLKI